MSRSRIDWDKGNRDERAKNSFAAVASIDGLEGTLPRELAEKIEGKKLKPLLTDYLRKKTRDLAIWQSVSHLLRDSKVRILAQEERNGVFHYECELFVCSNEAMLELESFRFFLDALAERYEPKGRGWVLYFWFKCSESLPK